MLSQSTMAYDQVYYQPNLFSVEPEFNSIQDRRGRRHHPLARGVSNPHLDPATCLSFADSKKPSSIQNYLPQTEYLIHENILEHTILSALLDDQTKSFTLFFYSSAG